MIESMAVVHMSEADVVKDIVAVLAKVRQGSEIVIEQGNRPVAVIKPSKPAGRMISEVIADLKARGSEATTWMTTLPVTSRKALRRTASHGIRPPGNSPRLQYPDRSTGAIHL